MFFGVNVDIKYLVEWLNIFVFCNECWCLFKFLIGESYGIICVLGFVYEL